MKKLLGGICLALLLAFPALGQSPASPRVDTLAKTGRSWDGAVLPPFASGRPEITILKITIPPRTALPLHLHPMINAGYLLKGRLVVVTEDKKTLQLEAGEALVEVVNKWHYGKNEGEEPAEIVVFYAGTEGEAVSLKETTAAQPHGQGHQIGRNNEGKN